jgi:simple sugar transport system permease protein
MASSGELLFERVGVYNIGIEGSILCGALASLVVTNQTDSIVIGVLAGAGGGMAMSLFFAMAVVVLRAEMVVAGLAAYFLALGITGTWGADYALQPAAHTFGNWSIPLLSSIPYVGPAVFKQPVTTYVALLIPFLIAFILNRTRHGLNMRTIGESPAAADARGIAVNRWRVFYAGVSGALAGIAGAMLTLGSVGSWIPNVSAGQGWIAIAVVIFAGWRPIPLIAGALLFGALGTLGNVAQIQGWSLPSAVFSAAPYVGTLVVVCVLAFIQIRRSGRLPWPAGLGQPFVREAR